MDSQPLLRAGRGFVGMTLGWQDVSPSNPGNSGRIPLWGSTSNVNERVVSTLVRREYVNPEESNEWNETTIQE